MIIILNSLLGYCGSLMLKHFFYKMLKYLNHDIVISVFSKIKWITPISIFVENIILIKINQAQKFSKNLFNFDLLLQMTIHKIKKTPLSSVKKHTFILFFLFQTFVLNHEDYHMINKKYEKL